MHTQAQTHTHSQPIFPCVYRAKCPHNGECPHNVGVPSEIDPHKVRQICAHTCRLCVCVEKMMKMVSSHLFTQILSHFYVEKCGKMQKHTGFQHIFQNFSILKV
ncbi:hypothetical protein GOODEAATRI_028262 [Goodea atripinnis]|uniref:Uncharacterized protein n=1 Tax=Goodea atripinnis TaxID=208336 RepID=A0ABV0N5W8_9TELE